MRQLAVRVPGSATVQAVIAFQSMGLSPFKSLSKRAHGGCHYERAAARPVSRTRIPFPFESTPHHARFPAPRRAARARPARSSASARGLHAPRRAPFLVSRTSFFQTSAYPHPFVLRAQPPERALHDDEARGAQEAQERRDRGDPCGRRLRGRDRRTRESASRLYRTSRSRSRLRRGGRVRLRPPGRLVVKRRRDRHPRHEGRHDGPDPHRREEIPVRHGHSRRLRVALHSSPPLVPPSVRFFSRRERDKRSQCLPARLSLSHARRRRVRSRGL